MQGDDGIHVEVAEEAGRSCESEKDLLSVFNDRIESGNGSQLPNRDVVAANRTTSSGRSHRWSYCSGRSCVATSPE